MADGVVGSHQQKDTNSYHNSSDFTRKPYIESAIRT